MSPPVWLLILALLAARSELAVDRQNGIELCSDLAREDRAEVFAIAERTCGLAAAKLEMLGVHRKSRQELRLRVFAHEADFEDYRRRTFDQRTDVSTLSFYSDSDREVVCAWQDGSKEARGQLGRQSARQVLGQFATDPPIWFEEGFAGYFEGLETDAYGDVMDAVNRTELETMRKGFGTGAWCPLFELMDLQHVEFYGLAGARSSGWSRATLYAQSWSLVFFLLESGAPEDRQFLDLVARRLDTGRWAQAEFKEELKALETRWIAFFTDGDFEREGELLKEAWDDLRSGEYHAARSSAARALDLDGGNRSARRVLAWAAYGDEEFDDAVTDFDRLLEGRPDDLNALLGRARALLEKTRLDQSPENARRAVEAGRRASEAAPQGDKHEGLILAADAAEATGDVALALKLTREASRLKGLPREVADQLREKERQLIKRSIGR